MPRRARAIARDRRLARDGRLKTFYENILRNAALNFNNKEIQDIQIAVRQMLERVTAQINTESSFKISYIQPCGSMEEKASTLKSTIIIPPEYRGDIQILEIVSEPYKYKGVRQTKYIEFDYLAIIDQPDDVRLEGSCPGCRFGRKSLIKQGDEFPLKLYSDDVFNSQVGRSIASLCSCFSLVLPSDEDAISLFPTQFSFKPANPNINGCPSCTVTMDTGCLTVMPNVSNQCPDRCSLILSWTSYVSSLSDFDSSDTLQTTKQIKYLPIHIDFIPARKISGQQINGSNPLFLVPKTCFYCLKKCRLSDCLSEVEYFLNNVSQEHRKSYLIIKYIYQRFSDLPQYHLKVILFQHCKICTDTSQGYAACVFSILRKLLQSYENGVLMSFRGDVNLLEGPGTKEYDYGNERVTLNLIIKELSNFKTWTLMRKLSWKELFGR